jgi:mRNA-degrading endonuclease RelE of RelBE toxin-antitoxin system
MNYISASMPKSDKTKRAEVHLLPEVFEQLKKLADKENRSLKNYMETVLINHIKEQKKK